MRNLIGKIALTTGSALVAGALLVIAYLAAGTFVLAGFLSAVFLVGEKTDVVQYVFAPIAFSAVLIFAAASWALGALGVGAWWLWKRKGSDGDSGPATPPPPPLP
jgi:formate hydrogenlyase subunit 3/multisubunit Na+/H+ antiporter MnhD subunit